MVVLCLLAIIGTFVTSYTRARADALGIDAKVGMLQRPERVVLLSAPQAFFGLAFNGLVLAIIVSLLAVTSWITAVQRISFVYHATTPRPPRPEALAEHSKSSQSSAGPDGTRAAVHAPSPQP
jgi:CDP-diacylglycerol--glycerol-3-phosphate 3-phosphatidyltransferase